MSTYCKCILALVACNAVEVYRASFFMCGGECPDGGTAGEEPGAVAYYAGLLTKMKGEGQAAMRMEDAENQYNHTITAMEETMIWPL